jgi:hypothetical protein
VIRRLPIAIAWFFAAACGPPVQPEDNFDANVVPPPDADPDEPDAGPPPFFGSVYVHSYDNLYAVDPETLEVMLIGPFLWPAGSEEELMTDIAIDRDGNITGISFGAVYAVDKDTVQCTFLSNLKGQQFNGLSWVPEGLIDPGGEVLIGSGLAGSVWRIDPMTGESVEIGDYGGVIESSGDIVSVAGFGTVATVKNGSTNDYLARIDELTGNATIIGPTGYPDIWGVGYWQNQVFGFVATNEFVLIDVDTGAATYVSTGPENWAGAGVTTMAPIVP